MTAQRTIYLDYAATTPTRPEVVEAMQTFYTEVYANPSSLHRSGRRAKTALEEARAVFAAGLGAGADEVIFTGGGSEADNLALTGVALANQAKGRHLITSCIEHHAVLHTCRFLESLGFETTYLPVDKYGLVEPQTLEDALRPDTVLVSIMHANNEIGTIQPLEELSRIAHGYGALFHTDAGQTAGHLDTHVLQLGADLLSLSAHKFYGPKGVGVLYVKEGVELVSLVHGGAQEDGRRAGTENLPGIVGAAKAFELALADREKEAARLCGLRDNLWQALSEGIAEIRLNGHPILRLPNNLNVCFKGVEAEGLLLRLSREGIEASMGSACNSESIEPSHVLQAINLPPEWERGALRLTLGCYTTVDDVKLAAEIITANVLEMQHSNKQGDQQ